jgi:hypothetical protein
MARMKLPANAHYSRVTTCPLPFADWMRSMRLATPGASAGKWRGRARSSARLTRFTGSARLAIEATGARRSELRAGLSAITRYLSAHQIASERTLLRLDGQYGTAAVLADLAGFAEVPRGKEYTVLDHPQVQARLHLRMIRSSRARKARSSAASTIVQTCQSAPRASRAAW